jgi:predicted nucleotide-binding protein (sugar kinase/HSP70/actin superfamily)
MYYIDDNSKSMLEEVYNLLNQLSVQGANNAYALANAFARLEQVIKDLQEQKSTAEQPIEVNNPKKGG